MGFSPFYSPSFHSLRGMCKLLSFLVFFFFKKDFMKEDRKPYFRNGVELNR